MKLSVLGCNTMRPNQRSSLHIRVLQKKKRGGNGSELTLTLTPFDKLLHPGPWTSRTAPVNLVCQQNNCICINLRSCAARFARKYAAVACTIHTCQ